MCLLQTNATADAGFAAINRAEKASKWERALADMAEEESVQTAAGLESRLEVILSWQDDPDLRRVRKVHMGRHRYFIRGRHTECHYFLCYIKVHKRDEEDREEDPRFKRRVLDALREAPTRTLTAPISEAELPAVDLPHELIARAFGSGDQRARQSLHQIARQALIEAFQATERTLPDIRELDRLAQIEVSNAQTRYWETLGQS